MSKDNSSSCGCLPLIITIFALWAFIRVMAHATQCKWGNTHPDDVTYKMAHDRWNEINPKI